MYLFFSDLHLGHAGAQTERDIERAFVRCLDWHEEDIDGLYLVGDIFDQFIEYRHMVPKGFVRMLGKLGALSDAGVPITYVVGNHDPWHKSYFEEELSIRVENEALTDHLYGRAVYVSHGDQHDPSSPVYRFLRPILRHPVPVALYKYLLPGDTGYALARWVNRTFHGDELDSERIDGLRETARHVLCSETEVQTVVFGHSHFHEITEWNKGVYMNAGAWRQSFTYGQINEHSIRLAQWNGAEPQIIESATKMDL